jgi:DNA primase
MTRHLARELRREANACDPLVLCIELGLIGGHGTFRRQAGGVLVRCCAHEDRTPSMSVTRGGDGTIRVRCFGCGFTADAIGLVQRARGVDFRAALAELARIGSRWDALDALERRCAARPRSEQEQARWVVRPVVDTEVRHRVYAALLARCPLDKEEDIAEYLRRRAILADAQAVGIGALPPSGDAQLAAVDELVAVIGDTRPLVDVGLLREDGALRAPAHRLLIPWRSRDGRISALQRRRLGDAEPRYVFPAGVSPADPFGADLIDEAVASCGLEAPLIVTEGALDCLARRKIARLSDERAVVLAVPSATSAREDWSTLFEGRHVVVAFDPDKSGDDGAMRFAATCLRRARSVERERARSGDWNETLLHALRAGDVNP